MARAGPFGLQAQADPIGHPPPRWLMREHGQHAPLVCGQERLARPCVHPAALIRLRLEFLEPDDASGHATQHEPSTTPLVDHRQDILCSRHRAGLALL